MPGPGESLVQVTAVGVCGSDLHWYADGGIGDAALDRPLVLGHEFAGVIRGGSREGERVAVDPAIPCEACPLCRAGHQNLCPDVGFAGHGRTDGALREFLAWPTELLHPLPDNVSDADGALLEPLGVAMHAIGLGHLRPGASVGVFGCGPIGVLLIRLARLAGAGVVLAADPLPHRRAAAVEFGADEVWDPAGGEDLTDLVARAVGAGAAGPGLRGVSAWTWPSRWPGSMRRSTRRWWPRGPGRGWCWSASRPGIRARSGPRWPGARGSRWCCPARMNAIYPRAIRLVERGHVDLAPLVSARFRRSRRRLPRWPRRPPAPASRWDRTRLRAASTESSMRPMVRSDGRSRRSRWPRSDAMKAANVGQLVERHDPARMGHAGQVTLELVPGQSGTAWRRRTPASCSSPVCRVAAARPRGSPAACEARRTGPG